MAEPASPLGSPPHASASTSHESLLSTQVLQRNSFCVMGTSNITDPLKDTAPTVETLRADVTLSLEDLKGLIGIFQGQGGRLTLEQFKSALTETVKCNLADEQLELLFDKMDTNDDGTVEWDELCTYVLHDMQEGEQGDTNPCGPLNVCPVLINTPHQLPIREVFTLSSPPRFVTASDDGTVCFWNTKMALSRSFEIEAVKASKQIKLTALVMMPNAFRIAVATSNRDVSFFDSVTNKLCMCGLHNIVCALAYVMDPVDHDLGWLVMGDLGGFVHILQFNRASEQLFNKPVSAWQDGVNVHLSTLSDTKQASSVVSMSSFPTHEPEGDDVECSVRLLKVTATDHTIITCSPTTNKAIVLRSLHSPTSQPIEFTIPKGVLGFDINERTNVLATGGGDTNVCLWNPVVPHPPLATLRGHLCPVSHVVFNDEAKQLISLGTNEELRIWNLKDLSCINTLSAVIPHRVGPTAIPASRRRVSRILWHSPTQSLLSACSSEFAVIQLQRTTAHPEQRTHSGPVKCVLFVPEYKQVVTADTSGEMCSWSAEDGQLLLRFSTPHGAACVTALARGAKSKRFVSGASDGSVVVWNLLAGTPLQQLAKSTNKEITGLLSLRDRLYAIGWNGKLTSWRDDKPLNIAKCPVQVPEDTDWQPDFSHRDDVHALAFCPSSFLATGSNDGDICISNIRSGSLQAKVSTVQAFEGLVQTRSSKSNPPRPSPSVDALIWLDRRQQSSALRQKAATLVSASHGGVVAFWNAFKSLLVGVLDLTGTQLVAALAVDESNNTLFAADMLGCIHSFDISSCGLGNAWKEPASTGKWKAHERAIVSLCWARGCKAIISGSADCDVRMFSSTGEPIGLFGQSRPWELPLDPSVLFPPAPEEVDEDNVEQRPDSRLHQPQNDARPVSREASARPTTGVGANKNDLEPLLGRKFVEKTEARKRNKRQQREHAPRANLERTSQPGFAFCQPFQAVRFSELASFQTPREPSAVARRGEAKRKGKHKQ